MKVLVLTRGAWDDSNSTGNTMSNFFGKWDAENIANIYVRTAKPKNNICKYYYSISDKDIIKSIYKRKYCAGNSFIWENGKDNNAEEAPNKEEENLYIYFRNKPSVIALWGQDFLWRLGRWKNNKLNQFLEEFNPDVIFAPSFHTRYTHRLLWYIKQKTNAKVVLFHADDYLSTDGLGGSLLEKTNRKLRSRVIKESAKRADLNYCISPKQQQYYSNKLKKEMKLLFKGADFSNQPKYEVKKNKLIRIVFVGSTLYGRWKTIGMLAKAIKQINQEKPRFELLIYSQYQPTGDTNRAMVIEGASRFMGKIPPEEVPSVLNNADIVLHVESFDEQERLKTGLSFSTKIVDCLSSGRCVMGIGWQKAASIDYLYQNDAALVATDEDEITSQLRKIIENPLIIKDYANNAWECGKRNHQIEKIQSNLHKDLVALI